MTIEIKISDDGRFKTVIDTLNPHIHITEVKCAVCEQWINEDEIVWAPNWSTGLPFCEGCCPEQPDYDD